MLSTCTGVEIHSFWSDTMDHFVMEWKTKVESTLKRVIHDSNHNFGVDSSQMLE